MSWKFGVMLVRHDFEVDISALWERLEVPRLPTGEQTTVGAATSSRFEDAAVGVVDGVTLVFDNFLPYDCSFEDQGQWEQDEVLARASQHHDILVLLLDGVTSTYGIALFSGGTRARQRGVVSGKRVVEYGDPIPGESGGDDETRAFGALSAFAGRSFTELLTDKTIRLDVYRAPDDST